MTTAAKTYTLTEDAEFFYGEIKARMILEIVDSRHAGRGNYVLTVAPVSYDDATGVTVPDYSESFTCYREDLREAG